MNFSGIAAIPCPYRCKLNTGKLTSSPTLITIRNVRLSSRKCVNVSFFGFVTEIQFTRRTRSVIIVQCFLFFSFASQLQYRVAAGILCQSVMYYLPSTQPRGMWRKIMVTTFFVNWVQGGMKISTSVEQLRLRYFFVLPYIYISLVLSVCFCFPKQIQLTNCNHHKLFTTTACAHAHGVDRRAVSL